jgi:hypothetical protein
MSNVLVDSFSIALMKLTWVLLRCAAILITVKFDILVIVYDMSYPCLMTPCTSGCRSKDLPICISMLVYPWISSKHCGNSLARENTDAEGAGIEPATVCQHGAIFKTARLASAQPLRIHPLGCAYATRSQIVRVVGSKRYLRISNLITQLMFKRLIYEIEKLQKLWWQKAEKVRDITVFRSNDRWLAQG